MFELAFNFFCFFLCFVFYQQKPFPLWFISQAFPSPIKFYLIGFISLFVKILLRSKALCDWNLLERKIFTIQLENINFQMRLKIRKSRLRRKKSFPFPFRLLYLLWALTHPQLSSHKIFWYITPWESIDWKRRVSGSECVRIIFNGSQTLETLHVGVGNSFVFEGRGTRRWGCFFH